MGEIADMGAGAFDDLPVGLEQRIGLARERRDLDRKVALQALRRAAPDGGERFGDALERREPEADLEHGDENQDERERAEGDDQRLVEGPRLVVDLLRVAGDRDQVAAVLAEVDVALDDAQPLLLGARHVAVAGAVGTDRRRRRRRAPAGCCPTASARTARPASIAPSRVTCQYQPDSGSSNSGSPSVGSARSADCSGATTSATRRAQIDAEPAVERALDGVAIDRGQDDAGGEQDDDRPRGRRQEEPERERASAHRWGA